MEPSPIEPKPNESYTTAPSAPAPESHAESLANFLNDLIKDPEGKKLLAGVINNSSRKFGVIKAAALPPRPKTHSLTSRSPYYKESIARMFIPSLDYMIENKKGVILRYDNFEGIKQGTLYARVNQALAYIVDYLDPIEKGETEGKYSKLVDSIEISQTYSKAGICLLFSDGRLRKGNSHGGTIQFSPIENENKINDWKIKLEEALENIKIGDRPVEILGMQLTEEEMKEQEDSLGQIEGLVFVVKKDKIAIALVEKKTL